jgi:regulator of protease activity HflC (stomatin/prohibitin superfamily)
MWKNVLAIAGAVIVFLGLVFGIASIHKVETGEVAVVKHFGQAVATREAGLHWDFCLTNSYVRYNTKVQTLDITTAAYSSDAQTMDLQMTIQYQIQGDKAIDIAKHYGSAEILQNRIESISCEKTKAVLSSHKAMDIIAKRAEMSPAVEEAIRAAIGEEYYVDIVTVVITNIDFSDAFETAVEEKMVAEQKQLKAEYENQQKVAAAEAEAKAKVVSAEAEAKANKLLEKSLTEQILRQMYIDKWNGQLPETVAGDSVEILVGQMASEKK